MIILILAVFGLIFGSFVNALVWRLRQQEVNIQKKKTSPKAAKNTRTANDLSIFNGRSMCPNCRHELKAKDLVPVLSWLSLKGKCRYCSRPISQQYPLVELLTAALFVLSYLLWPEQFSLVGWFYFSLWLVILTGLVALLVYDLKWMVLPNKIVYFLMLVAAIGFIFSLIFWQQLKGYSPAGDLFVVRRLLDLALAVLVGGGFFYLVFQVSAGKWIGGGDVKLGFLIGLIVQQPWQAFMALFMASMLGTLIILPALILKKVSRQSRVPFGPFLIIGLIIVRLCGATIVGWYKRKFLLY